MIRARSCELCGLQGQTDGRLRAAAFLARLVVVLGPESEALRTDQRKRRMASRATRRPTTRLVGSTSAIVSAGTRRRWRDRKPLFTERASGTSGSVPYIGHSTFPTTRPRLSATRKPVVAVRFKGIADTLGTYSPSLRKFPATT